MMMADHEEDGERLRIIREITSDYTLPDGACPSFAALYAGLQDLERDLHSISILKITYFFHPRLN